MVASKVSCMLVVVGTLYILATVGLALDGRDCLKMRGWGSRLSVERDDLESASGDFGGMGRARPTGVLFPADAKDVARMVRAAYKSVDGFAVSARGHGHSINGQALTPDGFVIEMSTSNRGSRWPDRANGPVVSSEGLYVDAWGGELWIDVLRATLHHGLSPRSWTDYLHLTVGGTLSNAGISGQAFHHGPQISNVLELDVVTGKGELLTCSDELHPDLFHAVLGGLGQFGVITRARISLEPAPKRVRWIRVLYSDFELFTRDQESLISGEEGRFDYVEGFVIVDGALVNNWRSSFSAAGNPLNISSIADPNSVLYCLELTKNYMEYSSATGEAVASLLNNLNFIPGSVFTSDLRYTDFLDRVHASELKLRSKGLWEVPHPWLNLFVPKSRIADFDRGVFKGIMGKKASGPVLIYALNKNNWDNRTSAVTPDEDVFYLVAFLRSAFDSQMLEYLSNENRQIMRFCETAGINVKRYLPHYSTQQEWKHHFGDKWATFRRRKMKYDPRHLLATGQRVFGSRSVSDL